MRRWLVAALAVAGAASVSGCLPQAATTEGASVNSLYTVAVAMSVVVAVIVWGLMTFAIIRYRRRPRSVSDLPPQTQGSLVLETIWTVGPLLAILVLFTLTLMTLNVVNAAPQQGSDPVHMNVNAFRWGWRMTFPDDGVSVEGVRVPGPVVELPVGRPVEIYLTSDDVIHSFFVPQFLYKKDAIPGHPNTFTVTIKDPGSYSGQCAEFCGIYHSQMPFTIVAVSEPEYEAWLAAQRAAGSTDAASSPGASS